MRTHGQLTERSRTNSLITPIGKGREGKGIGRERLTALTSACGCPMDQPQNQVKSVPRPGYDFRGRPLLSGRRFGFGAAR